uniref:Uncharacterized protein n=1 Tax=candidate division CPR3 bacterium TaxID=2268181 RepID=A0A7C4M251_UNCC3
MNIIPNEITDQTSILDLSIIIEREEQSQKVFQILNDAMESPLNDNSDMLQMAIKFGQISLEDFFSNFVLPEKREGLISKIKKVLE